MSSLLPLRGDTGFFVANSLKFLQGGFVPLSIGLVIFAVMITWRWGRKRLQGGPWREAGG